MSAARPSILRVSVLCADVAAVDRRGRQCGRWHRGGHPPAGNAWRATGNQPGPPEAHRACPLGAGCGMTSGWASAGAGAPSTPSPTAARSTVDDPAAREPIPLTVFGINEADPGPRWQALFAATWPGYRRWYLQRDVRHRPTLRPGAGQLAHPHARAGADLRARWSSWRRQPSRAGAMRRSDDDVAARMLTLWDPPRFLPGCSQAVVTDPEIAVCRNYDYSPELWERVVYSSRFSGPPGDRQQRLPVGSDRRDELRRARRLAQLRRPPRLRARLRRVAGRPVPARGGAAPCRRRARSCAGCRWRWPTT